MKAKQWMSAAVIGLTAASFGVPALADHHQNKDKQSVGEYTSDAVITTKVKAAIVAEKNLSALDVAAETHEGVVTLTGTVATAEQADKAAFFDVNIDLFEDGATAVSGKKRSNLKH